MALSLWVSILYNFGTRGVGGIMVSIAAFQAVDPGSIPGRRNFFLFLVSFFFEGRGVNDKLCNVRQFQRSTFSPLKTAGRDSSVGRALD